MTKCGHYYYEDRLGPVFEQVIRDGVAYPVMATQVYEAPTDDTVIAEAVFFDVKNCPVCNGGEA